ncbi:NUDIX domain-containing protein [Heyndrickxia oleronia]|uniref:NUDIX domain-containing protein n=1 Tax=Heyndrickxia oleronia TaxID=38875 RepID=A0AAW6STB6_9BACI|nr:NUDIX domain-containing protein [Heyndrickxia oleronia]MDH5162071.1 NUDIX domain-containing protein [Heyndrickxia oleronia]
MQNPFHHLARAVFINENKILLAQAKGYTNTFLPGGHVEFGESAKETLKREIQEEMGIDCAPDHFLGLIEHKWEKKGILHCEINQLFEVRSSELSLDINPPSCEPHISFFWCNIEELEKANLQPYVLRDLIKNYVNGDQRLWWASTLAEEINEDNKS